jgi:2-methylisocitrate lyase-like PEP mutase family enzyme
MASGSAELRRLMQRKDRVLAVMHPPSASHARLMQELGCEAGFVGTGGVVGSYTGLADVGALTMMECVQVAGWIAQAVGFPIIMDGDTGHGGIMAVRRMVRECIRAGIAGVRIDDQPLESKRRTQSQGVEVVPLASALARYRAAVEMRDELDPDFVIMAQCYARDAVGGTLEGAIARMQAYRRIAGVDWVQLESPHSVEEVRAARAAIEGPFSFMQGKMPRLLAEHELLALGINLAWYPGFTHHVMWAALSDFMRDFHEHGIAAWERFQASRASQPYVQPSVGAAGEGQDRLRELELRYARLAGDA